ncbi:unnamed protein product [Hydatigera taeniaeformis]|uniref:Ovule protein n=1 Tax=Hydatigena taeniaeformis TaxID=6205 RepID=A0A0R3WLY8_HYDTA|nr:unnamed protein product [Hydatigera taeniaeformis]
MSKSLTIGKKHKCRSREINFEDARTVNVNLESGPKMCLYTHKNDNLYKKARYTQFMRWMGKGVKDTRTRITRASD